MSIDTIAYAATTVADNWHDDRPGFWPIFPILWFAIIATIAFFAIRAVRNRPQNAGVAAGEARLAERYAAGEIDEEEYRAKRAVLRQRK